jgi:hypothetical protein
MNRLLKASVCLVLLAPLTANADELIYLPDAKGIELFKGAELEAQYFALASALDSEHILTFCGPATIAAVMNSLGGPRLVSQRLYPWPFFTQENIFTAENEKVKPYPMVEHEGLVLSQLAQFFTNLGATAEFKHADSFDANTLRDTVKAVLADPSKRLVINYSRRPIGQNGDGHISPVAAYDADSDRVLVLDVAKYKYPPVWLTIADLYKGMATTDTGSNAMRGFVVVSK